MLLLAVRQPLNHRCFDVNNGQYHHLQYFNTASSCLICRLHVLVKLPVTDLAAVDAFAASAIAVYVEKLQLDVPDSSTPATYRNLVTNDKNLFDT